MTVPDLRAAPPDRLALVAFDLDDTLAPSKSIVRPRMAELLGRLLERVEVCVISGGQFAQFDTNLLAQLDGVPDAALRRLHIMPTCGTQYYRFDGGWTQVYAEDLSEDETSRALAALEAEARRLGLWEAETWGDVLEDRGSQVTFSALGQGAPVDAKRLWDPDGTKRSALRASVAALVPDLEVRSGGSTSVDITRRGIDKAYGMRKLAEATGIDLDRMFFIGDRLDEAGNDYPVLALGVACYAVESWEETADYVAELIKTLPVPREFR